MRIEDFEKICKPHPRLKENIEYLEAIIALSPKENEDMKIFYLKKAMAYEKRAAAYQILESSLKAANDLRWMTLYAWKCEDLSKYSMAKLYEEDAFPQDVVLNHPLRLKEMNEKHLAELKKEEDEYLVEQNKKEIARIKKMEYEAKQKEKENEKTNKKHEVRAEKEGVSLPLTSSDRSLVLALELESDLKAKQAAKKKIDLITRAKLIKEILAYYEKAINEDANNYRAHYARGLFMLEIDCHFPNIKSDFEKASESTLFRSASYYGIGRLAETLNDPCEAQKCYQAVIDDGMNDMLISLACAALERINKNYESSFKKLSMEFSENEGCFDKACVDDFISACEIYTKIIPEFAELHFDLATCRLNHVMCCIFDKYEFISQSHQKIICDYVPKIIEHFDTVFLLSGESAQAHRGLGVLYWHLYRFKILIEPESILWKKSIKQYEKALESALEFRELEDILAIVLKDKLPMSLFDEEKNHDRLKIAKACISHRAFKMMKPDNQAEVYRRSGDIYVALGDLYKAKDYYEDILRIYGFVDCDGFIAAKIADVNEKIASSSAPNIYSEKSNYSPGFYGGSLSEVQSESAVQTCQVEMSGK